MINAKTYSRIMTGMKGEKIVMGIEENGKKLSEMDNRELFLALTGTYGIILQAQLKEIVLKYLKYTEQKHLPDDITLKTMVQHYESGMYDGVEL